MEQLGIPPGEAITPGEHEMMKHTIATSSPVVADVVYQVLPEDPADNAEVRCDFIE